jgi:hyaluronan synthase
MDVLNDNQEDNSGGEVVSTSGVKEFPAAELAPDIARWIFTVLIIVGLTLVVYMTFRGRLFQPLFQAAKASHWPKLVVRPSLWWGMMGMVLLVFRTIAWFRYRPFPSAGMADAPSLSVIIPAYNEGPMVRKSIDSVAAASYPHDRLEIFVVDDGSKG